jgi:hypothetical protein
VKIQVEGERCVQRAIQCNTYAVAAPETELESRIYESLGAVVIVTSCKVSEIFLTVFCSSDPESIRSSGVARIKTP